MREIANRLLEICCENEVTLVANQKVFDSTFVNLFLKNGILVLPRIGTQGICQLQSMTKTSTLFTSIRQLDQTCKNRECRVVLQGRRNRLSMGWLCFESQASLALIFFRDSVQ